METRATAGGPLLFGIQTVQSDPWPELVRRWRWFEELGFDSLWLPDHLVKPFTPHVPLFEAWTTLAGMAMATGRVRIGVLVSSNTFRHPGVLAKQAVTIDHMSGGRLELGLGAGWFVAEHEQYGLDFPEPVELVDRFREAVEVVDRLLRHEVSDFEGTHYGLRGAFFSPRPVQLPRPPLTLGAHKPKMLEIVARYADRWNSIGTPAEIAGRNAALDAACGRAGREPASVLRSLLYVPAQYPDDDPWQSVDAFADFVGRYREAGMREFLFQPPGNDRAEVVERIVAEVITPSRLAGVAGE
ncbi:MAG: LLM class flavin-dependent oxidoreductase [Chloroflexia bacterium]|nr:LLM class flavin-dependent oxidoreductase [Chloroflexia bacterium]